MYKQLIFFLATLLFGSASIAQQPESNVFQAQFDQAYQQYPNIPNGVLEAVSYTQTHFKHLSSFEQESCLGLPKTYGVMGLIQDGKNYFRENLNLVATLSGYSTSSLINSPSDQIMAYAKAYYILMDSMNIQSTNPKDHIPVLVALSELPDNGDLINNFALSSHIYSVLHFLTKSTYQQAYSFPDYALDMEHIFGVDNYKVLSSTAVQIDSSGVVSVNGNAYSPVNFRGPDYPPALWTPTPSCNYSSRSGTPVSAITIHTVQGTYAGAISWAQNCSANVSYHYVVRSSDGQVTQMLYEADKGWHVGSANPYTIGYEHEGYVSDPSWYTTAMYNSSAAITRDVVNSGYGINPLRLYNGPASSGLNTLGSCIRIKGHQHYPSQSHTDPGINWDWERYYKLVNDNPAIVTQTTATGTLYDSGGPTGNYTDDERDLTLIAPTGATSVSLTFNSFDLEANWDYMYLYDGSTVNDPLIGVYTGTNSPGTVTSTGGSLLLEFRSDCATTNPGWEASWTSNATPPPPADSIAPTTDVTTNNAWVTNDFTASFIDNDNNGGSGINEQYFQVIHFDGNDWRANATNGFFSDNFDQSIHPDWTQSVGTWAINNGNLQQSDEAESNTNIYASLDQNGADRYLYHWSGSIDGSGTNRRAGFHFFCDDASQSNRGNSYFVWFRVDNDKIQIYKVTNNSFSLEADIPYTINAGQWYDVKTTYDKLSGDIKVYLDNELSASWTDSSPLTSGDYISYRSGNATYTVNNLKVYKSRGINETVTVGTGNDLPYQNTAPTIPAGRVKSIVIDSADNISAVDYKDINVDWTAPAAVTLLNDGPGTDIDTFYTNTEIEANWNITTDQNSDISRYWYAIGTTPGGTDIVNWTDNWFYDTLTHSGLNLNYGITYFVSVRAENGAGLFSADVNSDGQYLDNPVNAPSADFVPGNTIVCLGDSIQFNNTSANASTYQWSFPGGSPNTSTLANPAVQYPVSGMYDATLIASGPGGTDTLMQTVNVNVSTNPAADFSVSDTMVSVGGFVGFNNNSSGANGYSWDFGDGNGSTDINPWHQYTVPGTYTVTLIAVNGNCPNDTTTITIYVGTTGISDMDPFGVQIYPNPVTDQSQLIFHTNKVEQLSVLLIDNTGRVVQKIYRNNTGKGQHQVSLSGILSELASGMYTLQFQSETTLYNHQLIID